MKEKSEPDKTAENKMAHHTSGQVSWTLLGCLCLLVSLCPCLAKAVEVPFIPKNILVYGGNGFIGTSTMEKLLSAGHKMTLINRGNWYWDSAFTVRPFVQHIKCDRMQAIEKCSELREYVTNVETIDAVIDFSAYHPQSVSQTLDLLKHKTKLYIYISTDSVYEVCVKNHTEPTLETDAIRPTSPEKQREFENQESYGHRKLQCEEVLADYRQNKKGPPYVSLRLPDVIGPRDNTYRWWIYQLWIKLRPFLDKGVSVPSSLAFKPMSLVYVNDIADIIFQIIEDPSPEALDQPFNLALKETPTLLKFLEDIRNELNLTDVKIVADNKPETIRLFPSVHLGPVDISKAEQILKWNPTPWEKVLKETVQFYEKAIGTPYLDRPRKDIIRTMQTYFTSKPYNVIRGLRDMYGIAYAVPKDEL